MSYTVAAGLATTLLTLAALQPSTARACSCMVQSQEDAAQNATAIFEGRVSRIEGAEGQPKKVHFKVVRSFKGPSQEALTVTTPDSSAACGYGFEDGASYLVYASETDAVLMVSLCSRTAPIATATEDLNKLGLGVTPFDPGPGSDQAAPPATPPPAAEPAKGGCASCTIGRENDEGEPSALIALALALGAAYRITSRRRSGSRS